MLLQNICPQTLLIPGKQKRVEAASDLLTVVVGNKAGTELLTKGGIGSQYRAEARPQLL